MSKKAIPAGTIHRLPADLRQALTSTPASLAAWLDITPLARNEWICWVENAKFLETRKRRIERTCQELTEGMRRPCCWIGCIHRTDKALSPSQKYVIARQPKTKG